MNVLPDWYLSPGRRKPEPIVATLEDLERGQEAHRRLRSLKGYDRAPAPQKTPAIDPLPLYRLAVEMGTGNSIIEDASLAGRKVRLAKIVEAASQFYGVDVAHILSQQRKASYVRPRQVAMYIASKLTLLSLADIGRRMDGRDHTTVMHAVRKVERLVHDDAEVAYAVEIIALAVLEGAT